MTGLVITLPGSVDLVDMSAAVNATWRAIRTRHRKIPAALVTIVPGHGSGDDPIDWGNSPVITLSAQTVSDGPEAVLAYLLHQAAHAWVHATGDAPAGRWHSAAYRDRARALLLDVEQDEKFGTAGLGWSVTSLTDAAVAAYGDPIAALAAASPDWEPPQPTREWKTSFNGIVAKCSCPDSLTIRIRGVNAAEKLAEHPVLCGVCGKPFQPV